MPLTGSVRTRAPARAQEQLERAHARASGSRSSRRGVADEDADRAGRRRRQALRALQPVVGPARGERPRGGVGAVALAELGERREQDLLDRALDGAQRQRGLHRAVGAVELEGVQRADQDVRVGAQRLARAGDRGGDRQPLLQRVAQRGDLAVRVEAVLARRALRLADSRSGAPRRAACSG